MLADKYTVKGLIARKQKLEADLNDPRCQSKCIRHYVETELRKVNRMLEPIIAAV